MTRVVPAAYVALFAFLSIAKCHSHILHLSVSDVSLCVCVCLLMKNVTFKRVKHEVTVTVKNIVKVCTVVYDSWTTLNKSVTICLL